MFSIKNAGLVAQKMTTSQYVNIEVNAFQAGYMLALMEVAATKIDDCYSLPSNAARELNTAQQGVQLTECTECGSPLPAHFSSCSKIPD